jgi:hypothetical protein
MRRGETTEEDIEEFINSRVVDGNSVCIPEHPELCYATATNKMRNAITAATVKAHIEATHPLVHSNDPPPSHTLMGVASMFKKGGKNSPKISPIIHEIIVATLGDDNVQQSGTNTKIDPVL